MRFPGGRHFAAAAGLGLDGKDSTEPFGKSNGHPWKKKEHLGGGGEHTAVDDDDAGSTSGGVVKPTFKVILKDLPINAGKPTKNLLPHFFGGWSRDTL